MRRAVFARIISKKLRNTEERPLNSEEHPPQEIMLACSEEQCRGHDSPNHENHSRCHEQRFHQRKRNANNHQHQNSQDHQGKPTRPVFPSLPPLARFVQRAKSPKDQCNAKNQPAYAVAANNSPREWTTETQPDQESTEHHENQLDDDSQQSLRREHGLPSSFSIKRCVQCAISGW